MEKFSHSVRELLDVDKAGCCHGAIVDEGSDKLLEILAWLWLLGKSIFGEVAEGA
jgi:hypothetical protein